MRALRRIVLGLGTAVSLGLVTASMASANSISATCTSGGTTAPCSSGWYPASVTVTWQASPPPQSVSPCALGLADQYATDTMTTLSCTATWSDGSSASYSFPLHVEVSTPTASAKLSRSPDHNGWYTSPVAAVLTASSFSGIASCTPATYSGPDATAATVGGFCTDNAGKTVIPASPAFQYEASSPTIAVTPSRDPDSNGWYNHAVGATVSGGSFSGIASCSSTPYSGPDSSSATVGGSCTDNAGKVVSGASQVFNYEASAPTILVGLSRTPDSGHWYNHSVSASVSGSSFSGIASCTGTTYSGPDSTSATVTGSCTDNAGKVVGGASPSFQYEASSPTVTVDPSRAADVNGWYTHPVAASVAGKSFSGIASCTPNTYAGPDSTAATVAGSCTDNAGKTTVGTSPTFQYEAGGPAVSATPSRSSDANGWYTHAVTASVAGTSVSGGVSCTATTYSGPDSTSATVGGTCTDNAGESASANSQPFRYEASAPSFSVTPSRSPDHAGWFWQPVTATPVNPTSFSGIASCTPGSYSGPDSTSATVSASCTDNAGKTVTEASPSFEYEGSVPTLSVALARAPDSNGWYNHPVAAAASGSSFSGIASCASATYSGPDATHATVGGSCTDNAGKTVNGASPSFQYEASSPMVSVGLSRPPDTNGWYTRPVSSTASGSSFSGIASCTPSTYSGPDTTSATVSGSCTDNAGKTTTGASPSFQYDASGPIVAISLATAPDHGGWYIQPVAAVVSGTSVSGGVSCHGTTYSGPDAMEATVTGTCTDSAGETTNATSAPFHYEASSPSIDVGLPRGPDSGGWYVDPVTASVAAKSFSGIASCSQTTYSGPDATAATVAGSCTDNAGKTVDGTSQSFQYEASTPAISVGLSRPPDSDGWYNHPVALAVTGSSFSGIVSCTPAAYSGPNASHATVGASCTDDAGKTVAGTSPDFSYDGSTPVDGVIVTAADRSISLHWSLSHMATPTLVELTRTPGRSGPDSIVYRGSGDGYTDTHVKNGVRYRYALLAIDRAGNVSRDSIVATPGPRLLAPPPGAAVTTPPLLSWTPVLTADYYNVQLYHGARKMLTAWPTTPNLRLRRTWRFDRHGFRLGPGTYRWYVWPGYGQRQAARYGRLIGSGTFSVT